MMVLFVGIAPSAAMEASTGKNRSDFVELLGKRLGGFLPENDIKEKCFFLPYVVPIAVSAVNGDSHCQAGRARFAQGEIGFLN